MYRLADSQAPIQQSRGSEELLKWNELLTNWLRNVLRWPFRVVQKALPVFGPAQPRNSGLDGRKIAQ